MTDRSDSTHPLDLWIESLDVLQCGKATAYLALEWPLATVGYPPAAYDDFSDWPKSEVVLARMLYGIDTAAAESFCKSWCISLSAPSMKKTWLRPLSALLSGSVTKTVSPARIFSIKIVVEGGYASWSYGLKATALTDELAVFSKWDDEFIRQSDIPAALGLIETKNAIPSSMLLLQKGSESIGLFNGDGPATIYVSGLSIHDTYRILLAHEGIYPDDRPAMTDAELEKWHNENNATNFDSFRRSVRIK